MVTENVKTEGEKMWDFAANPAEETAALYVLFKELRADLAELRNRTYTGPMRHFVPDFRRKGMAPVSREPNPEDAGNLIDGTGTADVPPRYEERPASRERARWGFGVGRLDRPVGR
jgi:hypothetical protein